MATALNTGLAPIWPLSVDRYHAVIDAGILGPDDRVELLEGVIVEKTSKNPPHRFTKRATRQSLERLVPLGWYVDDEAPITLPASEPEPDVVVVRGDSREYVTSHPRARDVGLTIEVAESSLDRDSVLKKRIYAAAGIPVYWIVDLNARRIEVFARPRNDQYAECTVYVPGDSIPVILDGESVGTVPVILLP